MIFSPPDVYFEKSPSQMKIDEEHLFWGTARGVLFHDVFSTILHNKNVANFFKICPKAVPMGVEYRLPVVTIFVIFSRQKLHFLTNAYNYKSVQVPYSSSSGPATGFIIQLCWHIHRLSEIGMDLDKIRTEMVYSRLYPKYNPFKHIKSLDFGRGWKVEKIEKFKMAAEKSGFTPKHVPMDVKN